MSVLCYTAKYDTVGLHRLNDVLVLLLYRNYIISKKTHRIMRLFSFVVESASHYVNINMMINLCYFDTLITKYSPLHRFVVPPAIGHLKSLS